MKDEETMDDTQADELGLMESNLTSVWRYMRSEIEAQMAERERRTPLAPPSEIVKLAHAVFGDREDEQAVVDAISKHAVLEHFDPEGEAKTSESYAEFSRAGREFIGAEVFADLNAYAAAQVRRIAGASQTDQMRSATEARPSTYLGKWVADSTYRYGDEVTHRGLLFHCWQDGTTDVPGESKNWQMKHKDLSKGSNDNRKRDRHGPGASA